MSNLLLPPVVLLFTIVVMIVLNQTFPLTRFWETHLCWVGIPVIVIGLAIANWHARLFKRLGTNINTFRDPDVLTTEGLFRHSRNPMYLGFMALLSGIWLMLGSATPLLAAAGFWLLTQCWYIPLEERAMLRKFGGAYLQYESEVRRWL